MKSIHLIGMLLLAGIFTLSQCQNAADQKALTAAEKNQYTETGKAIAAQTFSALSARLTKAMEEGGVPNAVQYCNLVAMPLVDSLSKVHAATIRRTSLKVRNPLNKPTEWERETLLDFETKDKAGEELKPVVQMPNEQTIAFAAPIRIQPLCVQCHGKKGETMTAENAAFIQGLYPDDQATGYAEGDLRGMWSITFKRK